MAEVYVLTQTFLGDGTFYVGVYDSKCKMFKDMKVSMALCGVDFDDIDEVKETLEQQWTYTTTEVANVKTKLFVAFKGNNYSDVKVSPINGQNEDRETTFISKINETEQELLIPC